MKVIFIKDLKKQGKKDEIIEVSDSDEHCKIFSSYINSYLEKKDNGNISTKHIIDHFIFSQRLTFEEKTRQAYNESSFLEKVFGRKINTRMREGFFPFTEPGYEIDMECLVCGGVGCKVCNHNGWIEVMPGGVIHPNVLKSAKLNPDEWTGFYINIGLDRLVMMRYGVDDVRLFHSSDLRFLKQFK